MSDLSDLLKNFKNFNKSAFQPWGGAPPQQGAPADPAAAAAGGGMPPGGAPPPGAPPMDPAAAAAGGGMPPGGAPPAGGIPPELEEMLSQLAGGIQQLTGVVQNLQQNQEASGQQSQMLQQELAKMKSSLTQPAPMEGMV